MKMENETAYEYFIRIKSALEYERTGLLDALPSIEAIVEYFELWGKYDTEFMAGMLAEIEAGANKKPLKDFIGKYQLGWNID